MRELRIIHLFPDLLNLYGEKGNIMVLKKRCKLRNIGVAVREYKASDKIEIKDADIIIIGGGSKNDVKKAYNKLFEHKDELKDYVLNGGVMLAISSGYEMIGKSFQIDGENLDGLFLGDFYSVDDKKRLIDNVKLETEFGEVVGFTNHSARFYLDDVVSAFGKVIRGYGNNELDLYEGYQHKNIFATSLHGPLLPKNPNIADQLIKCALFRKYGEIGDFADISDNLSEFAKSSIEF